MAATPLPTAPNKRRETSRINIIISSSIIVNNNINIKRPHVILRSPTAFPIGFDYTNTHWTIQKNAAVVDDLIFVNCAAHKGGLMNP